MERTPLGRIAQIYKTFTKNYKDLDKESAADAEMTDGAPIYHSDQEQLDKDWDCEYHWSRDLFDLLFECSLYNRQ